MTKPRAVRTCVGMNAPYSSATPPSNARDARAAQPARSGWTFRLGRFLGIDVYMHGTFLLLLAFFGLRAGMSEGAGAGVAEVAWMVALFGCVVLHEYGHALPARAFGIGPRDITLYPIGGVASLNSMPRSPAKELLVAGAGPLVNVVLAFLFAGYHTLTADPVLGAYSATGELALPLQLAIMNLGLGLFNLVPAFPMDGGRILRALLSLSGNRVAATLWAARVGRLAAFGFAVAGLFGNPMLLVIAAFIWFGAGAESRHVQVEESLRGASVNQAMTRRFLTLTPWMRVGEIQAQHPDPRLLEEGVFPVLSGGVVVGIVTAEALRQVWERDGDQGYVADAMTRDVLQVRPTDELESALLSLQSHSLRAVPVVTAGKLVGMLSLRGVASFASHRKPHYA